MAAGLAAAAEELACRGKEWENDDSRLEAENSSWISATELAVEGARKLGTVPAIDYTHRQSHTGFDRASDSRQVTHTMTLPSRGHALLKHSKVQHIHPQVMSQSHAG